MTILKSFGFITSTLKKPNIKHLKNVDLLFKLPFYEELNMIKTNHAFRGNAMSYKAEIIEKKVQVKHLGVNQVLKICLVIF